MGGGGGGPNFGSEWTVEHSYGKLPLPRPPPTNRGCRPAEKAETTTCFSICERRSPLAREMLLCEQRRTDHRMVPKKIVTFFEYPRNLVK